ncbi:hypothetical protein D9619_005191 [Psilocybe cf. subviscida]|uniref:Uncharacterized protein n=1 Tax=Psilocybe cf. subviscida TaxID=2480587 RepID=A0A8H5BWN5_9AGAR|nr:hypothetical protein D9619_005191 [Psilocybe cf. subviscida]
MTTSVPVIVISGFSLTNRLLLYASIATAPVALMDGIGSHIPINAGFLGFTIYQQYLFYLATKQRQLHALCMLPQCLNSMYAVSYLAGVSAGNRWLSGALCVGTAAVLIINNVTAWTAYLMDLPEGYGVYHFFFFGWRTLSSKWRPLFLLWSVGDSIVTLGYITQSVYIATWTPTVSEEVDGDEDSNLKWWKDTSLIWSSAVGMLPFFPFVLWIELIVYKNHIVSETDTISVYLFIVQIALLITPCIYSLLRGKPSSKDDKLWEELTKL